MEKSGILFEKSKKFDEFQLPNSLTIFVEILHALTT